MADISEPALATALSKVTEQAPGAAGRVETTTCDVSKESEVESMLKHVDAWGGADIVFNNAGIM